MRGMRLGLAAMVPLLLAMAAQADAAEEIH